MTDYEIRTYIAASGQVLCEPLPENFNDDDWHTDEYKDIDEWVVANAWVPYQHWDAEQLWEQISSVANTIDTFHKSELARK